MKQTVRVFTLLIPVLSCLLFASAGHAGVNLPWSTTFTCNDWLTADAPLSCDGLESGGDWVCDQGGTFYEQITADANNPGGGGGNGQRHFIGDGHNVNSGGTVVSFNEAQPELWIRWYMRYSPGFRWSSLDYQKILYIHTDESGTDVLPEWYGDDGFRVYAQNGGGTYSCDHCGWATLNKGNAADGDWHYYELHIRMDTNGRNGVVESWIDGSRIINVRDANLGTRPGWHSVLIGSNQSIPSNGGCACVDYDDIAINSTGSIGPVH